MVQTASLVEDGATPAVWEAEACLILLLQCDRPLQGSLAVSLAGVDAALLGRGDARGVDREERNVMIRVADTTMSSLHARLVRKDGWTLEDAGSKNGTLLNGERRASAVLSDGDVIELGQTLFLYRAVAAGNPAAAPRPELATFVASLEGAFARLARVAGSALPILVTGETGTGKEVVARAVHALSRRAGTCVAVNCAALPTSLVESQLFGHKKGAFSGALEDSPGLVRAAHGGTLFLDEIGDLPAPAQAALLRVLQEKEVLAVGATRPVAVDVRVIAATNRDLRAAVAAGAFRIDLLARLEGHELALPPLRQRREDVGLLVAALLRRAAPGGEPAFTRRAARALVRHDWPKNIRELEHGLSGAFLLAGGEPIDLPHLPPAVRAHVDEGADSAPILDAEDARLRQELLALLREHEGNVTAVARAMGRTRMQIHRWLRRWGIRAEAFRRG